MNQTTGGRAVTVQVARVPSPEAEDLYYAIVLDHQTGEQVATYLELTGLPMTELQASIATLLEQRGWHPVPAPDPSVLATAGATASCR